MLLVEKPSSSRDWHFGFETFAKPLRVSVSENLVSEKKSRFQFRKTLVSEKSLGFGFWKFGFKKKSRFRKNLVLEKSLGFSFGKFGLRRKVSASEKFGFGKKSRFRKIWSREKSISFGKIWSRKKVSVSVSVKILVSSFSDEQFIFHKKGVSNKPQNLCQKKLALLHSRPVQIVLNVNL